MKTTQESFCRFLFTLLLAIVSISPLSECLAESRCRQLTIGVVAPLSGGAASNGVSIRNSVLLADREFDSSDCVKFVFEDDQLKPKKTVTAVKKLIETDNVDALLIFGSPTSLAVNGIAERRKIPMIGLSIVNKVVEGKKFVVKHWVSSRREHEALAREVKRRGYKSVAIVTTTNDAMLTLRDLFIESNLAEVVINEELVSEELDFRTISARIARRNPDAVYILLWAPQPGVFAKVLRQSGYNGDLFGAHNLEDPREIRVACGALDGVWYVTGDDSSAGSYYQKYQSSYGELPANGGLNAYDSAKLFIQGATSADLNTHLHTVENFHGAYGVYSASTRSDFDIKAKIKSIKP